MSTESIFRRFPVIAGAPTFLSGPIGTQLALRNVPGNDFAAIHHPGVLQDVHLEYLEAGADILLTDTFSVSSHRLGGDEAQARERIQAAYLAVRHAMRRGALDSAVAIAGSLTSLGDCYDPNDTPALDVLDREHLKNVQAHKDCGADFLLCETLPTLREAIAMAGAASYCALPFILSFTVSDNGRLLDGNSIEAAEAITRAPLRLGIGANCCSVEGAQNAVRALNNVVRGGHIVAYPNGYTHSREAFNCSVCHNPDEESHKSTLSPQGFAEVVDDLVKLGATIVGGCCGAAPAHTGAYVQAYRSQYPARRAAIGG